MNNIKDFLITINQSSPQEVDMDESGASVSFDEINLEQFKKEFNVYIKNEIESYLEARNYKDYSVQEHFDNLIIDIEESSEISSEDEHRFSHNTGHYTVSGKPYQEQSIYINIDVKNPKLKTFIEDDVKYLEENMSEIKSLSDFDFDSSHSLSFFKRKNKLKLS